MFKTGKKIIILTALAFCMIICLSVINTKAEDEVVKKGVYAEEIDISGMTEKDAKKAIKGYVADIKSIQVNIKVNEETVVTTVGELGYKWANTDLASEAIKLGKKGNVIRRYKDVLDIDNNGKVFEIEMTIAEEDIAAALDEVCASCNVEAKDASLELTSTGFNIIPEKTGVVVNSEETATEIYKYITEKWDRKSVIDIEATTKIDEPKYKAEDLENISSTPMGTYTTTFSVGSSYSNRNANIRNGANLLDGAILYPDESYSLNEHLAPWTEENGYFPAGTYVDGGVQDSLGGGICQVSSTLYNALLLAEIEIVERYPHSMSVSYVPLAQDAALAGDYKDLVFKNNTTALIYVQAIYTEGSITFNIFGHDTREAGRSIRYENEIVSTTKIKTEVEKDDTKTKDYEEVVSAGQAGYVAKLWKYIYQDGEQVDKVLINTSTYRMSPKKVIKGTKKVKDKDKDKDKNKEKETEVKAEEETTKNEEQTAESTESLEE